MYTYYKQKKLLSIEIKPLSEGTTHTVDNFDLYKLEIMSKCIFVQNEPEDGKPCKRGFSMNRRATKLCENAGRI